MLVLIILGILFVITIVIMALYPVIDGYSDHAFVIMVIDCLIFTAVLIGLTLAIVFALTAQIPKEKDYQQALYEKQVLEYRLEHIEDDLVGNEVLYSDIMNFNNQLRTCKYYANSPWVGLFYNDKVATIDYIEISRLGESI